MAEQAKRKLVVCTACKGIGDVPANPFTPSARGKRGECERCKGDGFIRLPLPPPITSQDLG